MSESQLRPSGTSKSREQHVVAEARPPSRRTTLKRGPARARYDPESVRGILAEGLFCHLGAVLDGHPVVIPTAYGVVGDHLYVHGSTANRVYRALLAGSEACVTVTLLDGLVLARSAFHHSVNYRAVVLYGRARKVEDREEKLAALDAMIDHLVPGRSREARAVNDAEYARTLVLAIPLAEASAKVRSGPPVDDEEDYALDVWAGVVPLQTLAHPAQPDPRCGLDTPEYVEAQRAVLAARGQTSAA